MRAQMPSVGITEASKVFRLHALSASDWRSLGLVQKNWRPRATCVGNAFLVQECG